MQSPTQPTLPPMLRVPAEIRIQIYDQLDLATNGPISIFDASIASPTIGRVCRVMREEVMDSFYSRNRFMISNSLGLSAILNKITTENLSRITRLRLNQLETKKKLCGPFGQLHPVGPPVYIDIDFSDEAPWFSVVGIPIDTIKQCKPTGLTVSTQNLKLDELLSNNEVSTRSERVPEQAKFLLVPKLMTRVLQSIAHSTGGDPLRLSGSMLEYIVKNWLWVTHILACAEDDPFDCKDCERALLWLWN